MLIIPVFSMGYEWYNYVQDSVCCPVTGGCCQYGKALRSFSYSRLLSNDSLIDKRNEYVQYMLSDAELSEIPLYKEVASTGMIAFWVIVGLFGCMFIFLIEFVAYHAHRGNWHKPDYLQLASGHNS
jgi:hypothetical protein